MGIPANFQNFDVALPNESFVKRFAKDDQSRNKDIANIKTRADYLSYVSRNYDTYLKEYLKYTYTEYLKTTGADAWLKSQYLQRADLQEKRSED
jgi:hypothetical protein